MTLAKVLIIGCSGFLGSCLSHELLAKGSKVFGFYNIRFPDISHHRFTAFSGLFDQDKLKEFLIQNSDLDAIFFLAGSGSVGSAYSNPYYDFHNSAVGLSLVLDSIRELSLQKIRIVFSSSAAVYGCNYHVPISEDFLLSPISTYGVHKKISEDLISSYVTHYGLNASVLRFFSIYGPRNKKQLIWDAYLKFKVSSHPCFSGSGQELRDWLFIDDAVRLLIAAAKCKDQGLLVVNGTNGLYHSVNTILHEISKFFPGSSYSFDNRHREGDPINLIGDSAKVTKMFSIPELCNIDPGIHSTLKWYHDNTTC